MDPNYITLYHSGDLERRAYKLEAMLASCNVCPRQCQVNRLANEVGFCHSGHLPIVSAICAHYGEEPAISGSRGSGTIFFGNCNMRCIYCQNYQISQNWRKNNLKEIDYRTLAEKMIYLQDEQGCHNINFVSPSHFVPQIVRAVLEAVPMGLRVPLVYNTNGYDSVASLKELDGIISIYLPDLKYASNDWAKKFSYTPDYVLTARQAIKEMYRQVGNLITDDFGLAQQGIIVRHLVLPNGLAGSEDSLTWLVRELSPSVTISLMSQYIPLYRARGNPLLSRRITTAEYETVVQLLRVMNIENGWVQEIGSSEYYVPDFEREDHLFPGTPLL